MTPSEWNDLLDLWADDALPEDLAARVESRMASDEGFARDALRLRDTVSRLRAVSPARADAELYDAWLAERVLSRLLREQETDAHNLPPVSDTLTPSLLTTGD